MTRLSFVLAVLLVLSATSLITARFQSRQLFVASERLDAQMRDLEMDWRRLQLERSELARNARIDQIARRDLGMRAIDPQRTLYVEIKPVAVKQPGDTKKTGGHTP